MPEPSAQQQKLDKVDSVVMKSTGVVLGLSLVHSMKKWKPGGWNALFWELECSVGTAALCFPVAISIKKYGGTETGTWKTAQRELLVQTALELWSWQVKALLYDRDPHSDSDQISLHGLCVEGMVAVAVSGAFVCLSWFQKTKGIEDFSKMRPSEMSCGGTLFAFAMKGTPSSLAWAWNVILVDGRRSFDNHILKKFCGHILNKLGMAHQMIIHSFYFLGIVCVISWLRKNKPKDTKPKWRHALWDAQVTCSKMVLAWTAEETGQFYFFEFVEGCVHEPCGRRLHIWYAVLVTCFWLTYVWMTAELDDWNGPGLRQTMIEAAPYVVGLAWKGALKAWFDKIDHDLTSEKHWACLLILFFLYLFVSFGLAHYQTIIGSLTRKELQDSTEEMDLIRKELQDVKQQQQQQHRLDQQTREAATAHGAPPAQRQNRQCTKQPDQVTVRPGQCSANSSSVSCSSGVASLATERAVVPGFNIPRMHSRTITGCYKELQDSKEEMGSDDSDSEFEGCC